MQVGNLLRRDVDPNPVQRDKIHEVLNSNYAGVAAILRGSTLDSDRAVAERIQDAVCALKLWYMLPFFAHDHQLGIPHSVYDLMLLHRQCVGCSFYTRVYGHPNALKDVVRIGDAPAPYYRHLYGETLRIMQLVFRTVPERYFPPELPDGERVVMPQQLSAMSEKLIDRQPPYVLAGSVERNFTLRAVT